ncbi:uncharacterized protein LOC129116766 [Anoplopoma fimbria]|uniref:uncharacterized protein LOC129116766 n=1 Tax=Anoplopoma fimbria TaxID=229290 RepID=UPI0023ED4E2C|nr:uncharacterized protein LOC129116766 [Anoplopoma fimbria]
MKIVLLITITFTLLGDLVANQPCQSYNNNNNADEFVKRHIVKKIFDRTSKTEWERYIRANQICATTTQSFLEDQTSVEKICNGKGHPISNNGDLCISDSHMRVYELKVKNNCKVTRISDAMKPVIVACNIVGNRCRPVHFERYINQRPIPRSRPCRP